MVPPFHLLPLTAQPSSVRPRLHLSITTALALVTKAHSCDQMQWTTVESSLSELFEKHSLPFASVTSPLSDFSPASVAVSFSPFGFYRPLFQEEAGPQAIFSSHSVIVYQMIPVPSVIIYMPTMPKFSHPTRCSALCSHPAYLPMDITHTSNAQNANNELIIISTNQPRCQGHRYLPSCLCRYPGNTPMLILFHSPLPITMEP